MTRRYPPNLKRPKGVPGQADWRKLAPERIRCTVCGGTGKISGFLFTASCATCAASGYIEKPQ